MALEELIVETIRPRKYLPLKQRAMNLAHWSDGFHFDGPLHVMRMQLVTKGENRTVSSRWLAAVYLLFAHAALWQKTRRAVRPGQIDFANIRLGDTGIQDYVLYRTAKGICSGMLGTTSEELSDPELVSDGTLLLVVSAAVIARYGPEAIRIGRNNGEHQMGGQSW